MRFFFLRVLHSRLSAKFSIWFIFLHFPIRLQSLPSITCQAIVSKIKIWGCNIFRSWGRPCATLIFERGNLRGTPLEVADVSGSHFRFQHSETSLQHSEMSFQHSEIENFDFSYFEARTCPDRYQIWHWHLSRSKSTHPLFLDRFPERFLQPQSAVGSFRLGRYITCETNGTDWILVTSTFSTLKIDFSSLEIDFSSLEIAFGTLKFVSSTLKITSKHFEMDAGCVLALWNGLHVIQFWIKCKLISFFRVLSMWMGCMQLIAL